MDEKLTQMLKYLRLGGLLGNWDRYLSIAQKGNYSHARLLEHVVEQEYQLKKENARKMRLTRARIPEKYVIETFPFDRQPKLNKKKIVNMYDRFDYMEKCRNLIFMGPTGTGKTGLATAFLTHAIDRGYNGRFVPFAELVEQLYQSVADHTEARVIRSFAATDCLVIDELGYVEVEPVQVGLFFTLMNKRHKKKTTLITSNLGFSQWSSFLKNDHLTAALIDRLTENSHVVNMKNCVSLRPKLDPVT
ncbi:IstB4: IstB-like ATP-binding protein, transposase IS21 family [Desulfosarcina variabilis str. Montpellier]|uniref:IS21-like element helper ATPase IstB n=1 Tax=Desulfosarcina variabilis TaxID=2300 RepID=UPI003AFB3113